MSLDSRLLEILACPVDKQGLLCFSTRKPLQPSAKKAYRVHGHLRVLPAGDDVDDAEPAPGGQGRGRRVSLTFGG